MKAFKNLRWLLLPLTLVGAACSTILGIEDIHGDPKPGTGDGGDGNGGTGSGTSGTSGASGSVGSGGTSGASGSTGIGGTSGDAGSGGEGDMGGGGTGGVPDRTVRGKIVTTWMQPVPNTTVMIGDAQADTDANGEFEIPDVADEYDAKFVLNYDVFGNVRTYGWVYLGLTRRDPTLQVYNGLAARSGNIGIDPNDLTGTAFDNRTLAVALGGPDGASTYSVPLPNGYAQTSAGWQGPSTTQVAAHALLFEHDADDVPTAYRSFDEILTVLSESQQANMVFSVEDKTVPGGTIAGSVTSASSSSRTNYVFVRFQSNASMELIEHYGSSLNVDSFSYFVPTIAGASIEIGALEGDWSFGPAAIAHRDRLAAGQTDVELTIPSPPQQVAPADQITGVNDATLFSWTSTAQTFVWNAENVEPTSPYGGMYVVTSEKRLTIPSFPNGFTLIPGDLYNWRVETHGDAASVDELADADGFADSWAPYAYAPESPKRGDGTYTISGGRLFTTAP
jgi:hypothetical protein